MSADGAGSQLTKWRRDTAVKSGILWGMRGFVRREQLGRTAARAHQSLARAPGSRERVADDAAAENGSEKRLTYSAIRR
jgi:hypothetical protein